MGGFEATYSEHAVGSQTCYRVRVKIARSFSALALLQNANDWAFVWRGRDDGFLTVALDALALVSELDRLKMSRNSSLQWFGGQPFANQGSAEWGDLRHGVWFLPAITWKLASDQTILIVQTFANDEENLRNKLVQILEEAFAAREVQPSVPEILDRRDTPSYTGWAHNLDAAKEAFRKELFSKVVLSRSSLLKLSQRDSWRYWLKRLLQIDEESYVFALKSPDGRSFLGRSPERLLAWKDGVFQVDAIAGTRKRGNSQESDDASSRDLQDSSKDLVEHRFVTQYIARLLRSLHLDFEVIDDEKLLRLKHVQHLRTRFQGHLSTQIDAVELLNSLHPTPAVGGLPTEEAVQFILEHEESERGLYAGFIGWWGGSSGGECAIGIRSALVFDDQIRVFAGAGIVADSDSALEWEETELKMQNFLFGLEGLEKVSQLAPYSSPVSGKATTSTI